MSKLEVEFYEEIEFDSLGVHNTIADLIRYNLKYIGTIDKNPVFRSRDIVFVLFDDEYPWILAIEFNDPDASDNDILEETKKFMVEMEYIYEDSKVEIPF